MMSLGGYTGNFASHKGNARKGNRREAAIFSITFLYHLCSVLCACITYSKEIIKISPKEGTYEGDMPMTFLFQLRGPSKTCLLP